MKATKILSLILALVMLCSCLIACSGDQDGDEGNGGEVILDTNVVDESEVYDAEVRNLNGHEFIIAYPKPGHIQTGVHEVYAESLNGDKINDAVFTRNSQLEEKYNCKISEYVLADQITAMREPLLAGEYICDLTIMHARGGRTLAAQNLLADLSMLDNIDLSKAWYDEGSKNGMNVGNKVFFIAGDAVTKEDRASWICWVNRDFMRDYDSSIDLYQEVLDGKWTADRMYQLVQATARDLNGDQLYLPGEDRMGYICERASNLGFVCACGVTIGDVDDAGNWSIPLTPKQELLDAWAGLRNLITTDRRELSASLAGHFLTGLGTFYIGNLGTALEITNTTYDIGVMPMPKLNEEQEFYHTGCYYSQLAGYAIPMTVNNVEDYETNGFESGVEQAAYFLEALSYYSRNILTPAFYDQVLLKQAMSDLKSVEILEIALAHKVYDPIAGLEFGSINIYPLVGSNNQKNTPGTDVNYDNFVSTYEARVNAARKALQDYIDNINISYEDDE